MTDAERVHVRLMESGTLKIRTVEARPPKTKSEWVEEMKHPVMQQRVTRRLAMVKEQVALGRTCQQIVDYLKMPRATVQEYIRRVQGLPARHINHRDKRRK